MTATVPIQKSLDRKLAAIHADPSGAKDFILADAKDADMAFGIGAPGKSPEMHAGEVQFRTLAEFRDQIRQVIRQGAVDIMLMSASTNAQLAVEEGLFDNSHVTPAARANDASDVFAVRHGRYLAEPARAFRTALVDHIQCGHVDCDAGERARGANLGLYSVTFNNRLDDDLATLEQYGRFREEAERKGFRHFLEIFDPNAAQGLSPEQTPSFINDCIARTLAGVAPSGRPIFLKIVYHGPRAMEELVRYDPHLVVGILGGSAGTTYDAFKLLAEARKYGARAALFGRKINNAECQLAFIQFLRLIVEDRLTPEEAVRAYHGVLERLKIKPHRSLADDLVLHSGVMSYGGSTSVTVPQLPSANGASDHACECKSKTAGQAAAGTRRREDAGKEDACACHPAPAAPALSGNPAAGPGPPSAPDFAAMSQSEKRAYQQAKRDRIFG